MKNVIATLILCISINCFAQVGIGTETPSPSAQLDITATDKGLLIPRVQLVNSTDPAPITNPEVSLIVFNIMPAGNLTQGYHYWNGTSWVKLISVSDNQFDNTDDALVNDPDNGRILLDTNSDGETPRAAGEEFVVLDNGNVGIGTATPDEKLVVDGKLRVTELSDTINDGDVLLYVDPVTGEFKKAPSSTLAYFTANAENINIPSNTNPNNIINTTLIPYSQGVISENIEQEITDTTTGTDTYIVENPGLYSISVNYSLLVATANDWFVNNIGPNYNQLNIKLIINDIVTNVPEASTSLTPDDQELVWSPNLHINYIQKLEAGDTIKIQASMIAPSIKTIDGAKSRLIITQLR